MSIASQAVVSLSVITNNKQILTNSTSPLSMYFVKYSGSPGSPPSSNFAYLGYGLMKDASMVANANITTKIERILCAISNETDFFLFFTIFFNLKFQFCVCSSNSSRITNCSRKKSIDN